MNTYMPSEAREWFTKKVRTNWAATLLTFPALIGILQLFNPWWLSVLLAGVGSYGLLHFLDKRAIVIECLKCKGVIDSRTPWLCGYGKDGKLCENENTDVFPFIHKCEHCDFVPKAYQCHHCGNLLYLTDDRQTFQFAKCLSVPGKKPAPTIAAENKVGDRMTAKQQEIHELRHQLEKTQIIKQIEIEKNRSVGQSRSPEQDLEDEIDAEANGEMTLSQIEARLKARADVEFANDEHKRQQKHAAIERAIAKRIE